LILFYYWFDRKNCPYMYMMLRQHTYAVSCCVYYAPSKKWFLKTSYTIGASDSIAVFFPYIILDKENLLWIVSWNFSHECRFFFMITINLTVPCKHVEAKEVKKNGHEFTLMRLFCWHQNHVSFFSFSLNTKTKKH
jgi:hypothetical protein